MDIGNPCACMGPQATDPYCPCQMQRKGIDGYYNCNGDKEALDRRHAEDEERFKAAMRKLSEAKP